MLSKRLIFSLLMGLAACQNTAEIEHASVQGTRFETVGSDGVFPVSVPGSFESVRGNLIVPEDRANSAGRSVRLPVIVIKARNPDPDLAPVLFLPGGPGVSGLSAAQYPGAYPFTDRRDFIIMAQRGTHTSDPALMCPEYAAVWSESLTIRAQAAQDCRARLMEEGIDPSAYHTTAIAQDIEALRQVLDIEAFNLFALSYGTRIALTFARDYPQSVEAMVLDSPLPYTARYDDESAENRREVLQAVADQCAANAYCDAAYPNLGDRFFETITQIKSVPLFIAGTKDNRAHEVTAADLVRLLDLESASGRSEAPFLMDAIARRDFEVLRPLISHESGQAPDFAWGMRLSVWCSESLAYSDRVSEPDPDSFAGLDSAVFHPDVCAAWDIPKRPADDVAQTLSDVPTLILAGEYDYLTPLRWGEEAAANLSNSRVLTVPNAGHTITTDWDGDGCAMRLAYDFLTDPEGFLIDADAAACLNERPILTFESAAL